MNKEMNIQEVEKILAEMPKFERGRAADELFYAKLYKAAETKEASAKNPAGDFIEKENFFSWLKFPRFAFSGAFAVLLIIASGIFWAYQPGVTYGHALYGLKRAAEQVELAFAFSPLSKVDAHLNFSDRRLEEADNIMGKPSAVAFLLQTAFADEGEVDLTAEEENNLEKTLDDMKSEVDKASEIIETRVTEPGRARSALERIEQVTDRHIETLAKLEKRVRPPRIKEMVRRISGNEDLRMAIVTEAREDVAQALEKRERNVKLILQIQRERMVDRRKEAGQEMQKALEHLETLPLLNQQEFQFKIETVKDAFEKGKFGQAEGLSRAMQKRMLEFKPVPFVLPAAPVVVPLEPQPLEQQPQQPPQPQTQQPQSMGQKDKPGQEKPEQKKPEAFISQPLFFIKLPQPTPQPASQSAKPELEAGPQPELTELQPVPEPPKPQLEPEQLEPEQLKPEQPPPPEDELFQILQELKRLSR